MIIIPVMDILNGIVVQRRTGPQKYYKLESILTNSAEPMSVLCAIRDKIGCKTFYITDLNARHRNGDNLEIINNISKLKDIRLLVDAGTNTPELARKLMEIGSSKVVVGTKYLPNIERALEIIDAIGSDNVVFAVELENYKIYANSVEMRKIDPIEMIKYLQNYGLRKFIIYELTNIGTGIGIPSEFLKFLCRICEQLNNIQIFVGGGIRNMQDIITLKNIGVYGCLVGSALHNGAITKEDIQALCKNSKVETTGNSLTIT
jgi:phosphoribosylformimino-5-aminoimidazole carboxamide ribotide isomerase